MGEKRIRDARLKTTFALVLLAVFLVSLVINVIWTDANLRRQMESELLERGQVISLQMNHTWRLLSENRIQPNQFVPENDELNCASIGRAMGYAFTASSDYVTCFVSLTPRNPEDAPDEFERAGLTAFVEDGASEHYAIEEYEGKQVFRYLAPMLATQSCLDCHGTPAGELDPLGYPKEGLVLGDVVGATSVVVPMDDYLAAEQAGVVRNVTVFVTLLLVALAVVYLVLTRLVTSPLAKMGRAFDHVRSGKLDTRVEPSFGSREMNGLACEFNKMADELAGLYAGLESQVEERTSLLKDANATLEQQRLELERANELLLKENKYKSDFLSMVSHELRTPLTSIVAFSEMLMSRRGDLDEAEATAYSEIESQSRALLFMIDDILEMNRVDAGRSHLNVEAVDLCDLLSFAEPMVAPIAQKANVELSSQMDSHVPVITADFDKLAHALLNLMFNAIKFTPAEGSVQVRVSYDEASDTVLIDVADTGIGIDPADQERIFERFYQVDSSSSRRYNGSGLGLPLARQYVEMHGGSLTVKSEPGHGSVFSIRIPRVAKGEEATDAR